MDRDVQRVKLFGCPIDNLSMEETLERIERYIKEATPHQHVSINVHKVVSFQRDPQLRETLQECALASADGQPIVWASRLLGKPLKARIAGIDLMQHAVELAARKGYTVYFLGARPEVLQKVVEHHQTKFPSLRIAGFSHGYWSSAQERAVVQAISEAKPDILLVAMGSPRKELFLRKYVHTMQVPFAMGVGGSFDVLAGKTRRAPLWVQRAGLEWLWRVAQEPGRLWSRYFVDGVVFPVLILKEIFARRAE